MNLECCARINDKCYSCVSGTYNFYLNTSVRIRIKYLPSVLLVNVTAQNRSKLGGSSRWRDWSKVRHFSWPNTSVAAVTSQFMKKVPNFEGEAPRVGFRGGHSEITRDTRRDWGKMPDSSNIGYICLSCLFSLPVWLMLTVLAGKPPTCYNRTHHNATLTSFQHRHSTFPNSRLSKRRMRTI